MANAEFSEGEWAFLVVHGDREAQVRIEPHGRGVTKVDIVLSESLPEKNATPKEIDTAGARSEPRYAAAQLSPSLSIRDTDSCSGSPVSLSRSPVGDPCSGS